MIRVHVICEGQTEEMFINSLLANTFSRKGIHLYPSLLGKPGRKGGNLRIGRLLPDIRTRLLGDSQAYCTTFFDFYGLPEDFPGKQESRKLHTSRDKARCLLEAITEDLKTVIGEEPMCRFIPYVQMHEFEGLLFSDPQAFARGINRGNLVHSFISIRAAFETPEDINDAPKTAPSKRIEKLFAAYDKPLHGSLAAKAISLDVIRRECPLFNEWLSHIEALPRGEEA